MMTPPSVYRECPYIGIPLYKDARIYGPRI